MPEKLNNKLIFFLLIQILLVLGILLSPTIWMILPAAGVWLLFLQKFRPGVLRAVIAAVLIYFVLLESSLFVFLIGDRIAPDPVSGTETMIVPGAVLAGDQPGLYLKLRLDRAAELLKEYPGMAVVVTGWQGPDETVSEAEAMKNYLISQGVQADRILEEKKGYDTIHNFEFSRVILEEKALSSTVIIITNDFHSFRSEALARTTGLRPVSVTVPSPGLSFVKYLFREAASLLKVQLHYGLALQK